MKKLEVNKRLCKMYLENEEENEIHFLLKCPKYNDQRAQLCSCAMTLTQNFNSLPDEQLLFHINNCMKYLAKYLSTAGPNIKNVCLKQHKESIKKN